MYWVFIVPEDVLNYFESRAHTPQEVCHLVWKLPFFSLFNTFSCGFDQQADWKRWGGIDGEVCWAGGPDTEPALCCEGHSRLLAAFLFFPLISQLKETCMLSCRWLSTRPLELLWGVEIFGMTQWLEVWDRPGAFPWLQEMCRKPCVISAARVGKDWPAQEAHLCQHQKSCDHTPKKSTRRTSGGNVLQSCTTTAET